MKSIYDKTMSFFCEISAVPRGSGKTEKISTYCENFAKSRNLRYIRENIGNIIIFKDGTQGRENEEPVIIQGHLDMVCEKNPDCNFDFENSGLVLREDRDYIFADGTTLGGDDGIAVAIALAILDSDTLPHPPLEVVFTVDEEVGMIGASALDTSVLRGHRMINLDSEDESTLLVSCAGGARTDIELSCNTAVNSKNAYEISIGRLHGGHSGTEINKGYANATKLMGEVLKNLSDKCGFSIASINGGTMDNAITRECRCVVCTNADISALIDEIFSDIIKTYATESKAEISVEKANTDFCFDKNSTADIISMLNELPQGVIKMSDEISGLPQTSLNLGITETDGNTVHFGFSVRSSVNAEKDELTGRLEATAKKYKATVSVYGEYPAWEYNKNSALRPLMIEIYKNMFGKELKAESIHAGVECGIFSAKISNPDFVSIGPDIFDIHTPMEKMSLSSVKRMCDFITETLKNI